MNYLPTTKIQESLAKIDEIEKRFDKFEAMMLKLHESFREEFLRILQQQQLNYTLLRKSFEEEKIAALERYNKAIKDLEEGSE